MDDNAPALEVGFALDLTNSFVDLARLDGLIDQATANALTEFAKVEKVAKTFLDLGGATASITKFGNEATKAAQQAKNELAKVEKAGEALSKQLDRQTASYGRTREEMRATKVEAAALAAQQQGLTELAARLRAQEQALYDMEFAAARRASQEAEAAAEAKMQAAIAAEQEARAVRDAAAAHAIFEAKVRQGALAHKEAEAAASRDAIAVERLREMLDPAAAAQTRLTNELAEARRVMIAAGASAEELARVEAMLAERAQTVNGANGAARMGMQQLSFQLNDIATMYALGAKPMQIFASQAGQVVQAIQMMGGGASGFTKFLAGPWGLALTTAVVVLAPFVSKLFESSDAAKAAEASLKEFQKRQDDIGSFIDATTGKLIEQNAALVRNAILRREDQMAANKDQIASGTKQAFAAARSAADGGFMGRMAQGFMAANGADPSVMRDPAILKVIEAAKGDIAKLDDGLAALAARRPDLRDTVRTISDASAETVFLARKNKELADEVAKLSGKTDGQGKATSKLIELQVAYATATSPLEKAQAQLALVRERGAAADKLGGAALEQYRKDLTVAERAVNSATAAQKAATSARHEANKAETTAQRLARDASAIDSQIANLKALAAAYGLSGAAALEAQIRVKAQSDAIRKGADEDAYVARQVRLALAQHAADAAKTASAMNDQARVQEQVNAQVAAGIVPAERSAELVRDQIAELPILAAIQLAQQKGLKDAAEAATRALDEQRAARQRLSDAESGAQFTAAQKAAADRLEMLEAELRLIGQTESARVHALATLQAWRQAQSMGGTIDQQLDFVRAQVAIADQTYANQVATDNYNESLRYQAELLDAIDQNAQNAARGMADAFGAAGRAIGEVVTSLTGYAAAQERLRVQRDADVKAAGDDAKRKAQIETLYATKSATAQIGLIGDVTSAAKGFLSERSKAYKALETAEKAFRAIEFAMSVKAMAQDAAETVSSLAKSGARAAANGVEAVSKALASVPWPLNLVAGAATAAALASIGIAIAGAFGGGGKRPETNDGTGTVFGDSTAKSDSIKRSLDLLADLDNETLLFTRQMADSLKSIESNIGGLTNLVIRLGGTDGIGSNAAANVNTGYDPVIGKTMSNLILGGVPSLIVGPLLSKIPVIGDILGFAQKLLGGLFGTKTSIVGQGIFGGAQSLADIEGLGFAGQTYADLKRKKKVFGVTTSTKYSTTYGDLDDGIESQFGKLILSFADAIKMASGPLGLSLDDIEAKLAGFTVDIGRIDLKDLSGEEIQEKLTAVFGALGDKMAAFAVGGLEQFQKVGEGYLETLVRVASTVETVTSSLQLLGLSAQSLGTDASMAIADMFGGASDYQQAAGRYFEAFYTDAEQTAAKTAALGKVFDSLGVVMPGSIAAYRSLVEAQDLTSAAGQALYAQLIQLAPAFADVVNGGQGGGSSAASILRERQDLEKQLLEMQGDTAALRAMELAQMDPSNRALQERIYALRDEASAASAAAAASQAIANERAGLQRQLLELNGDTAAIREMDLSKIDESNQALLKEIWAKQDQIAAQQAAAAAAQEAQRAAEEAARAADQLRQAWTSVADGIMDEVKRIRGSQSALGGSSVATLQAQFDAATAAARGGNQDAASSLPEISRALLEAAAAVARDKASLDRISGITAASLEETYRRIMGVSAASQAMSATMNNASSPASWWQTSAAMAAATPGTAQNDTLAEKLDRLTAEVAAMRQDNNDGNAAIAEYTGDTAKVMKKVNRQNPEAITIVEAAA